tara:strand:+ start:4028 stop:5218 length:1191 start_codon:yes stop_codon:yes gene_type:complete
MKVLPLFISLGILSASALSEAQQVKKGGIFGFGRDTNELSSELFPDTSLASEPVPRETIEDAIKPPEESGAGFNIFRGGKPKKVDNVSYVIEDGQKVEVADPKEEKKGLFSFGKKENLEDVAEENVISPVPAPKPVNSTPVASSPELIAATNGSVEEAKEQKGFFSFGKKNAPTVEEVVAPESTVLTTAPQSAKPTSIVTVPDTAAATNGAVEEVKEKKGFFSMFSKDTEPVPDSQGTLPSTVDVSGAATTTTSTEPLKEIVPIDPVRTPAPAPAPISPPEADATSVVAANAPVPEFEGGTSSTVSKENKEGGFFTNPISKLRPKKEVDMTGAETIIQNGKIVADNDSAPEIVDVSSNDGPREPPRIIDGVKTYSSWDDVEAAPVSAADKILKQLR